jgi:flagellar hook-length control protein FliK
VVSVTSEVAASVSFQIAPPKAARPDPLQASERFGALVDGSASSDNSGVTPVAPQQPAPPRRADDAGTNADNPRPRDSASADSAGENNSGDRDAVARQTSDAKPDANPQGSKPSPVRSSAEKNDGVKSTEKSASDNPSQSDASTTPAAAPQDGTAATPPNANASAVAVAIPVTIALTDTPALTPASGDATATLAIGATIAASAQAATAPAPATAIADDPAAVAVPAATPATAKIAIEAAPSEAVATTVKATQNSTAVATTLAAATESALTAAVAATPLAAPKTSSLKGAAAEPAKTTALGTPDTISSAPDPSATATPTEPAPNNAAQQSVSAAKQQAGSSIIDAAKADDATSSSTSLAIAGARDHAAGAATANAPTNSADTTAQTTGALQPQLSSANTATPVPALIVSVATNAPVPLNGLALEIAASARSGKSRFEIRLDPADLGRIDVRIDVDRNGQVTSHLTVEKPETLSMLRQDAPQLQRALDDAGFKTGDGGLQFSLRDQPSSGQNNGQETSRNAQRLVISEEDSIAAAIVGQTYGRVLGSSSGVDIRV